MFLNLRCQNETMTISNNLPLVHSLGERTNWSKAEDGNYLGQEVEFEEGDDCLNKTRKNMWVGVRRIWGLTAPQAIRMPRVCTDSLSDQPGQAFKQSSIFIQLNRDGRQVFLAPSCCWQRGTPMTSRTTKLVKKTKKPKVQAPNAIGSGLQSEIGYSPFFIWGF